MTTIELITHKYSNKASDVDILGATARQRYIAFLKTFNLAAK